MRKLRHDEIPRPAPEALPHLPRHPLVVLVDNVRSVYNVGALFRTSDGACVERVILAGITPTPEHPNFRKSALGAEDFVPWSHERDATAAVRRLRADGYTIAALELTDEPTDVDALGANDFPLCLVVGHELHGVSDDVLALADLALEIPQYGAKQSLNVAVAYGIAAFDLVRRYRTLHGLPLATALPDPT